MPRIEVIMEQTQAGEFARLVGLLDQRTMGAVLLISGEAFELSRELCHKFARPNSKKLAELGVAYRNVSESIARGAPLEDLYAVLGALSKETYDLCAVPL